jgi:recombinational DNA repair ATPase RecF
MGARLAVSTKGPHRPDSFVSLSPSHFPHRASNANEKGVLMSLKLARAPFLSTSLCRTIEESL